jgi:hypothetical protein
MKGWYEWTYEALIVACLGYRLDIHQVLLKVEQRET